MEIRTQAHAAYRLMYYIVWIPKFRQKIMVTGVKKYCEEVIRTYIAERYPDVSIEEIKIMKDHVHMVAVIPPKYAIAKVVGDIKANSSKEIRKKFEYIRRNPATWSIGYFVSSVGLDEKKIRQYVQYQEKQDKGQTKFVLE
ncbi:IS200/IS605 family transposase [candidate division WWE3 bacterium]|uniref:IS200/IS605 family transposase n=1 Tax=candidate division WWE3 bacterium TaxID=2053526 RepID=A0A955LVY0_UNCKA|nr:IS200/IS605 family transposase [candidate division WWE3 bacterium]